MWLQSLPCREEPWEGSGEELSRETCGPTGLMRVLCQQKHHQLGQEERRGHHFRALRAASKRVELLGASVSCPSGKGGMAPGRPLGRGQTLSPQR